MIFSSYQRYKDGNRDFYSHFSVIFEIKKKFLIVFVRLILRKVRVGRFVGPRREIDIKDEFDMMAILKGLAEADLGLLQHPRRSTL